MDTVKYRLTAEYQAFKQKQEEDGMAQGENSAADLPRKSTSRKSSIFEHAHTVQT
jgi:hypothetical protein